MKAVSKALSSFGAFAFVAMLLPSAASAQYVRKDLVTDVGANNTVADANLKNAWGMASAGGGALWVSANDTGKALLFNIVNGAGGVSATINPLVVTIPSLTTGETGSPTGTVANIGGPNDFLVTGVNPNSGKTVTARAAFLFATLDGTISGWNPNVFPTDAVLSANRSDVGAVYTGLTTAASGGQTFLYAADGGPNRRVDVFDSTFQLHSFSPEAFVDPSVPRKFAPYGIQSICQGAACNIWVTYTALGNAQSGFISEFTTEGVLVQSFALNGPMHSPWGLAIAPGNFGQFSGALLVSNNISRGRIDAFDIATGQFLGSLRDENGQVIEIDQLWGIRFGLAGANGLTNQLFFTAGTNEYGNGLLGVITAQQ